VRARLLPSQNLTETVINQLPLLLGLFSYVHLSPPAPILPLFNLMSVPQDGLKFLLCLFPFSARHHYLSLIWSTVEYLELGFWPRIQLQEAHHVDPACTPAP
jgi:hypothetical protein